MLSHYQINCAIRNFEFLITHSHLDIKRISIKKNNRLKKNKFFSSSAAEIKNIKDYIETIVDELSQIEIDETNQDLAILANSLQNFLNLDPNPILTSLNLDPKNPNTWQRHKTHIEKFDLQNGQNQFKGREVPKLIHDGQLYKSPDDDKAFEHGYEALRIFFATQKERFKSFISKRLSKLGIFVFEKARYQEHDYLETEIYAHDLNFNPLQEEIGQHYWVGHATNLLSIPRETGSFNVLTDPVEGDLNSVFYPRMTREAALIDGKGDKKLPKIDLVVISHNHRDHLDKKTLRRLVKQQPIVIVPEGDESRLRKLGFKTVISLNWWEQAKIQIGTGQYFEITAVPSRHWSGTNSFDAHHSGFNGYVFQSSTLEEGAIYFAGDTARMDDKVIESIFNNFNITSSIQPGGPDEMRADMESTHQSSADAILMHFKILLSHYQKNPEISLEQFKAVIEPIKTIYNHTGTFKLGNLHLKDSYYSHQRLMMAFQAGKEWAKRHLTDYEFDVFQQINAIIQQMQFEDGVRLLDSEIADLIQRKVIVPKIGQRQPLFAKTAINQESSYRGLITNRRALQECDKLTKKYLDNKSEFNARDLILNLLRSYHKPWHASFSRHYNLENYLSELEQANKPISKLLDQIENDLDIQDPSGHLQSLINYSKWILANSQKSNIKLKEFFAKIEIDQLLNDEMHHNGHHLLGKNRQAKKDLFRDLAFKLAAQNKIKDYPKVIYRWKRSYKINDYQNLNEVINENRARFFKKKSTHGASTLQRIEAVLEKFHQAKEKQKDIQYNAANSDYSDVESTPRHRSKILKESKGKGKLEEYLTKVETELDLVDDDLKLEEEDAFLAKVEAELELVDSDLKLN